MAASKLGLEGFCKLVKRVQEWLITGTQLAVVRHWSVHGLG